MSTAVALALVAWGLANAFGVLTVIGFATLKDQSLGTRLWACSGGLAGLFGGNAYALDSFQRYFSI